MDLRGARRKSGLTQEDCGHLLGGSVTLVKQLEDGKRLPSIKEICTLSLIFGKSFESLFGEMMDKCRGDLTLRLGTLPTPRKQHASTFNRKATIDALCDRLATDPENDDVQ